MSSHPTRLLKSVDFIYQKRGFSKISSPFFWGFGIVWAYYASAGAHIDLKLKRKLGSGRHANLCA